MILPGHLAAGYLAAHYAKLDEKVALVAAIAPDVVDKTAHYLLRVTPTGRVPLHSLLGFSLVVLLVMGITRNRAIVWAWALGHLSHLLMDSLTDLIQYGASPEYLLWPVGPAQLPRYATIFGSVLDYVIWAFVVEGLVTVWGILAFVRARQQRCSD